MKTAAELTPRKIVEELDRYIVGQAEAKRAVAIAIRNRLRRQRIGEGTGTGSGPEGLRPEDILPKNLILIGPTGVGKTEIARRIAHLVDAPFVKVEASKFTEVGYVGRDVESMIRDLVEAAVGLVRGEQIREVEREAARAVEERLLDALERDAGEADEEPVEGPPDARERLRVMLQAGRLEERRIEIAVQDRGSSGVDVFGPQGVEHMGFDFQALFDRLAPARRRERKVTVREARRLLQAEESERLVDREKVNAEALRRAETSGIIFLDEIDKICLPGGSGGHGPDVSRGGVQRDLLPIVEGSVVNTRYGPIRTDHVLFIAAGAFHTAKPTDLIPELQGRFPIRVELRPLGREDLLRIIREPRNALTRQYTALLAADGVRVRFTEGALAAIARIAHDVNARTQDIGARRLHGIFERLLEDALFEAPEGPKDLLVDDALVHRKLAGLGEEE